VRVPEAVADGPPLFVCNAGWKAGGGRFVVAQRRLESTEEGPATRVTTSVAGQVMNNQGAGVADIRLARMVRSSPLVPAGIDASIGGYGVGGSERFGGVR
jgi:hypothetical protein